jgi:hypothetical protein
VFLDAEINREEAIKVIDEATSKGLDLWREARMKFVHEILDGAGISRDNIGMGKLVDVAKLSFASKSRPPLIRACGGAHKKIDGVGNISQAFKCFLEVLPAKKPRPDPKNGGWQFDEVEYEPKYEKYLLPESFITELATEYLTRTHIEPVEDIKYEGKHLTLPCIKSLIEGNIGVGSRSFGAQQVAIAARLDGLSKAKTTKLIEAYVTLVPQVPDPFGIEEATKWVDWVFNQSEPYFACGQSVKLGVCDKNLCPMFKERHSSELKFFDTDKPLKVIKEQLDKSIVGEDKLKMQLFLLYLTKEFDPEWCIMLDGSASSGKTHVMKEVAKLFGKEGEDYFIISRFTGRALSRLEEEAKKWQNAIVVVEEMQGAKDAMEELRVLISEGKLRLHEVVDEKAPDGTINKVTRTKVVELKNTIFVTCQAEEEDEGDQLRTRAWVLNTDQTSDQNKKVVSYYLRESKGTLDDNEDMTETIGKSLKLLNRPDKVVIPFADELEGILPVISTRARRDVKKLLSLIKASAFFHQFRRHWFTDVQGHNVLVADWRDLNVVMDIAWETINATAQGLGAQDLEYYDKINSNITWTPEFGLDDVGRWTSLSPAGARKIMSTLVKQGFFENSTRPPEKAVYKKTCLSPAGTKKPARVEITENMEKELEKWVKDRSIQAGEGL